ncbi:uncharacterized protein LOC105180832 [Harpegnathos saltator]|uniref:uncharacterized protein LOC105180832 n=1 Tax=Harpegnathos saltator TaxID=610380 RepID=UPI00058EC7EE|nr:uncharacterized protein LOC105180832 [Harpegnathos saltator]XP_019695854.1 uncharacterized protein LOC105180832 [Harpegnathos saltator]
MSPLVLLLSVLLLSLCCASSGASDERGEMPGGHASGAMSAINEPLTPLPKYEGRQFLGDYPYPSFANRYRPQRCPLCDSSVYPYCGEKMFHDACCCSDSHHDLPYQCRLADCGFLHANSCREHRLIANCCCSDDYRALLKNLAIAL